MISQFFVLSARGDTIINRDCNSWIILLSTWIVRHDLVKNTPEIFFRNVKLYKGDAPPIFVKNDSPFVDKNRILMASAMSIWRNLQAFTW